MWDRVADFLNSNPGIVAAVGFAGAAAVALGALAWRALAHIYNFRKLKKKHNAVQKNYAVEKKQKKQLEHVLAKMQEVQVYREWLFMPHDPAPRMPLCPSCFADGKRIRLSAQHSGLEQPCYYTRFTCFKCSFQIDVDTKVDDKIFDLLGLAFPCATCNEDREHCPGGGPFENSVSAKAACGFPLSAPADE